MTSAGGGGAYFFGADGEYPGVSGNTFYAGVGVTPYIIDAGQWTLTYWPQGDRKSYIGTDCRVKIDELRQDILYGNASPIGTPFSSIFLGAARTLAARFAESKAIEFDIKHGGGSCSC